MNPEHCLLKVSEAIEKRDSIGTKRWSICYLKSGFQCLPARTVINNGNVFGTYSEDELKKGLTTKQWNDLAFNIAIFAKSRKETL